MKTANLEPFDTQTCVVALSRLPCQMEARGMYICIMAEGVLSNFCLLAAGMGEARHDGERCVGFQMGKRKLKPEALVRWQGHRAKSGA